jgi:Domain of unknown function (DUF6316)
MKAMEPDLFNVRASDQHKASAQDPGASQIKRMAGSEAQRLRKRGNVAFNAQSMGNSTHNPRIEEVCGKWFFQTREGTTEGPFPSPKAAERALEAYISVVRSEKIDQGALSRINSLSLEPLDKTR